MQEDAVKSIVFIIDDDEAVRDSLNMLMSTVGQPCQLFHSPAEFLETYDETLQGCIILDIRMPGMSGLELQSKLNSMRCTLPVIFITGHGDVPMAVRAIQDGAMGFIQKPFRDQELLDLINDGLKLDMEQRKELLEHQTILKKVNTLTEREREILFHVVQGKPNKLIASEIQLSQRTVEIHRSRVMEKMGTKSLAHLVRQVIQVQEHFKEKMFDIP